MIGPTIRGHNGGPPLDEPVDRRSGQCKHCIHWDAPPENEQRAYEWFHLGLSRRRVKRPSGTCDRVLPPGRKTPCSRLPRPSSDALTSRRSRSRPLDRGDFVTIWRNGRIAWQGPEENIPPRFLQDMLDPGPPDEGGSHDDAS